MTPARAAALGLLHGPLEQLPVSSSAHVGLITRLAGWQWDELPAADRKALEVSFHAGAATGLLVQGEAARDLATLARHQPLALALAVAPVGLTGLALERQIEGRLGGRRTIALGLLLGGLAMALSDRRPGQRQLAGLRPADGLAVGLAQTASLIPGVSRLGATTAAARLRGFEPAAAARLSRAIGLPVVASGTALKATRSAAAEPALKRSLAAGAAASLVSTLIFGRLLCRLDRAPLWPFAGYRATIAMAVYESGRER